MNQTYDDIYLEYIKTNDKLYGENGFRRFVKTCAEIVIGHISSIPTLSMEVFSSAHSILFQHCHIDEIESSAFSGVLVNNITFDSSSVDRIHTSAFPDT